MLELRSTNPMRPVDWRWQRAKFLSDNGCKATVHDDNLTSRALKFARRAIVCLNDSDYNRLLDDYPELFEAWHLYKEASCRLFRFEIEARVMADEPIAAIARKTGIAPAIITAYEDCFFEVRPRLDAQSYIQQGVLQPAAMAGIKNREYDLLWKLYGYWGGPVVLDTLIYGQTPSTKPDSPAGVAAFWQDDIADQVRQKAAVAMRKMAVDSQTSQDILTVYQKMVALERTAGEGKGANEGMLANINAMLGELPWHKYQRTEAVVTEVDQFDAAGVNLRAEELIAVGVSGGLPQGLRSILMSAQYPPERPSRILG